MKVLCVDNSGLFQQNIKKQLFSLGIHNVVVREDVASAAAYLELDPDLTMVICDHDIDGGSGLDFLRWSRSHGMLRVARIPFIMITGSAERELILNAADVGVSGFLIKPVRTDNLQNTIRRATNEAQGLKEQVCV
jgi:two-component system chemotaxis response regulator CheY